MTHNHKNKVLTSLAGLLKNRKEAIIEANRSDMQAFPDMDDSMRDRLKVDDQKIEAMIRSLEEVALQDDPEGKTLYEFIREDGLKVVNRTVPFGTILIIYESRPEPIRAAPAGFATRRTLRLPTSSWSNTTAPCISGCMA